MHTQRLLLTNRVPKLFNKAGRTTIKSGHTWSLLNHSIHHKEFRNPLFPISRKVFTGRLLFSACFHRKAQLPCLFRR